MTVPLKHVYVCIVTPLPWLYVLISPLHNQMPRKLATLQMQDSKLMPYRVFGIICHVLMQSKSGRQGGKRQGDSHA